MIRLLSLTEQHNLAAIRQTGKPVVREQLRKFNPTGAAMLERGNYAWLFTKIGLLKALYRICFGKEI